MKIYLGKIRVALERVVDWELVPKNQAKKVKSATYEKPAAEFRTKEEARRTAAAAKIPGVMSVS